jgi:serine/threonine protein kinase
MVMEYCPHGDLSNFIKHKKKIPQHMVVDIMSQILNGYNYLANLKILHRDLKPSNILRSGKIWKIADFGFSVRTQKGFTDNINVGTPMYMPVESLSRSFYSTKSDIFALGVILY